MFRPARRLKDFFGNKAVGGERVFLFLILPVLLLGTLGLIYGVLIHEDVALVAESAEGEQVVVARLQPLEPKVLIRELESAEAQEKNVGPGGWETLLERYQKLTGSNPENDRAWGGYGRSLLELGRADEALHALDHACLLSVVEARHFAARAAARRALGDQRGALADLSDSLRLRPGDSLVANRLLFVALEAGGASLFESKMAQINKARGSEPEATWVVGAVAREVAASNFDAAMGLMEQARELLPEQHLRALLEDPIFGDRRGREFLARVEAVRVAGAGRGIAP